MKRICEICVINVFLFHYAKVKFKFILLFY